MLHFEAMLAKLLAFNHLFRLPLCYLLDVQLVDLLRVCLLKGRGNVIVSIKVLIAEFLTHDTNTEGLHSRSHRAVRRFPLELGRHHAVCLRIGRSRIFFRWYLVRRGSLHR